MLDTHTPYPEFIDTWRIREVGNFSLDEIDRPGKALIQFHLHGTGILRFLGVEAKIDCRYVAKASTHFVEFTWTGFNEAGPAVGRGWACVLRTGGLMGHLFIHRGKDWPFMATRIRNLSRKRSVR